MSSTFSQIYIHVIFAVKGRRSLIKPEWETDLHKYISGIITNKGQKLLAINGMPDHIHILIGMRPSCCLSDLVREIKKSSNSYINQSLIKGRVFLWQEGFGAFSHCPDSIDRVISYIHNQKEHHTKNKFRKEYKVFLNEYEVEFKEEYLFDWID
ncbi:IS200/IS605 family transposase [Echinicola shivajiensis]|uniref:IS200/IS605 family transposase n=1 Tax=Echinicola shivajiensis TaxID=1035916 RepID=UPI001BFCBB87|nr:IS200/IS605 family transposase [Echinicola shivajiensis]